MDEYSDSVGEPRRMFGVFQPGQRFGPYEILGLLGRGGMGEVYAARHLNLSQDFALKVIGADIVSDAGACQRFELEARASFRLAHPRIVRVDNLDEVAGQPYLRMELMEGVALSDGKRARSLEDYFSARGGRMPMADILPIMHDVLSALAFAHGKGIIHRDIKPANILLFEEAGRIRAKLGDFGLIKVVGEDFIQSRIRLSISKSRVVVRDTPGHSGSREDGTSASVGHGHPGSRELSYIGTYDYMAPELKEGGEATLQSDLYAIGLVAFRALTGRKGLSLKRPSQIVEVLDSAWDEWIEMATDPDPADRATSAEQLRVLLPGSQNFDLREVPNQGGPVVNRPSNPNVSVSAPKKMPLSDAAPSSRPVSLSISGSEGACAAPHRVESSSGSRKLEKVPLTMKTKQPATTAPGARQAKQKPAPFAPWLKAMRIAGLLAVLASTCLATIAHDFGFKPLWLPVYFFFLVWFPLRVMEKSMNLLGWLLIKPLFALVWLIGFVGPIFYSWLRSIRLPPSDLLELAVLLWVLGVSILSVFPWDNLRA